MWSPQGCISVEAPCEGKTKKLKLKARLVTNQIFLLATFLIHSIKWNPDGNSLILMAKEQFCVTYLQPAANQIKMDDMDNEKLINEIMNQAIIIKYKLISALIF